MLCIVQVFERAVSVLKQIRKKWDRCCQQTIATSDLEVMSQHVLNQNGALALCSDEMGCVCC